MDWQWCDSPKANLQQISPLCVCCVCCVFLEHCRLVNICTVMNCTTETILPQPLSLTGLTLAVFQLITLVYNTHSHIYIYPSFTVSLSVLPSHPLSVSLLKNISSKRIQAHLKLFTSEFSKRYLIRPTHQAPFFPLSFPNSAKRSSSMSVSSPLLFTGPATLLTHVSPSLLLQPFIALLRLSSSHPSPPVYLSCLCLDMSVA